MMGLVGVTGLVGLAGDGVKAVASITGAHDREKSWDNALATAGNDVVDGIDGIVAGFREGREGFAQAVRDAVSKVPVIGGALGLGCDVVSGAGNVVASAAEGVVTEAANVVQGVSDVLGGGGELLGGGYEASARSARLDAEAMPESLTEAVSERGILTGSIGWLADKVVDGMSGLLGGGGETEAMTPAEGTPVFDVESQEAYLAHMRQAMSGGAWDRTLSDATARQALYASQLYGSVSATPAVEVVQPSIETGPQFL